MNTTASKFLKAILAALSFLPALAMAAGTDAVSAGLNNSGFMSLFGLGGLAAEHTLSGLILGIITLLLFFAGAVAILFIIIGGFWYITSAGNEEQAEKGKNALFNAIIGIVIILMSYAVVRVISNTVSSSSAF